MVVRTPGLQVLGLVLYAGVLLLLGAWQRRAAGAVSRGEAAG